MVNLICSANDAVGNHDIDYSEERLTTVVAFSMTLNIKRITAIIRGDINLGTFFIQTIKSSPKLGKRVYAIIVNKHTCC